MKVNANPESVNARKAGIARSVFTLRCLISAVLVSVSEAEGGVLLERALAFRLLGRVFGIRVNMSASVCYPYTNH